MLGTSGFLYRSNKVMYDAGTTSLWSTLHGEPVSGPLVGKGIKLRRQSVVTTTWGKWKKRHPKTSVLSLNTGHKRDYGEGVAYQSYFATDEVMFSVPKLDKRLPNKREIVALRNSEKDSAVAVDTEFLKERRLYDLNVGKDKVLIVTTPEGESRVYHTNGYKFVEWNNWDALKDEAGNSWSLSEHKIERVPAEGDKNKKQESFSRYPSHQSFWFGWNAQFPKSRLITK